MAALGLQGCGDNTNDSVFTSTGGSQNNPNGGGGAPLTLSGVTFRGTVSLDDFGGISTPNVQTVHQMLGPVDSGGDFNSTASGVTPQLVFFGSGNGGQLNSPRGLSIFLPGLTEMNIDARSTAIAFVFIAPGVMDLNPQRSQAAMSGIPNLQTFPAWLSYLRGQLPSRPLLELIAEEEFQRLLSACIEEWTQLQALARVVQSADSLFTAEPTDDGTPSFNLSHGAPRFVSIIRQQVGANGQDTTPPVRPDLYGTPKNAIDPGNLMCGLNPVSWGNFFTGQSGTDSTAIDRFEPHPDTVKVVYWVLGAGTGVDPEAVLPDSIKRADFGISSYLCTSVIYFLLPALDVVSGGLAGIAAFKLGPQTYNWKNLLGVMEASLGLNSVTQAGLQVGIYSQEGLESSFRSAMIDLLFAIAGVVNQFASLIAETLLEFAEREAALVAAEAGLAVVEVPLLPAIVAALSFLGVTLAAAGSIMGFFNLNHAILSYLNLPNLAKIETPLVGSNYIISVLNVEALHSPHRGSYLTNPGDLVLNLQLPPKDGPDDFGSQLLQAVYLPTGEQLQRKQITGGDGGFSACARGNANRVAEEPWNAREFETVDGFYYPQVVRPIFYADGSTSPVTVPLPSGANPQWGYGITCDAVNDDGLVVSGYSKNQVSPNFGFANNQRNGDLFIYDTRDGSIEELGLPELLGRTHFGYTSVSIDNDGEVAAVAASSTAPSTAFLWKPARPLENLPARVEIIARNVAEMHRNNKGEIVYMDSILVDFLSVYRLFYRGVDGVVKRLQIPSGYEISPTGNIHSTRITDNGTVMAYCTGSTVGADTRPPRGVLFRKDGEVVLLPENIQPTDINDNERIVGIDDRDLVRFRRTVLLTPKR